jgi:predicted ester cyclase
MAEADPKEVARLLIEGVVGQGRSELAETVVSTDIRLLRPGFRSTAAALGQRGHGMAPASSDANEGLKRGAAALHEPFPDYYQRVLRQVREGDTIVNLVEIGGTHLGRFFGIEATGKRVSMEAVIVTYVENGKVTEVYALGDELGLLLELGATLQPPSAGQAPSRSAG